MFLKVLKLRYRPRRNDAGFVANLGEGNVNAALLPQVNNNNNNNNNVVPLFGGLPAPGFAFAAAPAVNNGVFNFAAPPTVNIPNNNNPNPFLFPQNNNNNNNAFVFGNPNNDDLL